MTDQSGLLWNHAIDMEDYTAANEVTKLKVGANLGKRSVTLCSFDEVDPITGRHCILLDNHMGDGHRVDTPLLDSDQWEQPEWKEYEAVFGRHVTPSE